MARFTGFGAGQYYWICVIFGPEVGYPPPHLAWRGDRNWTPVDCLLLPGTTILASSQTAAVDRTARQVVLAAVAILVVAVAAATLPNPVMDGGSGGATGGETSGGGGEDDSVGSAEDSEFGLPLGGERFTLRGLCFPFLLSPLFVAGALLVLSVVGYIIYRKRDIYALVGAYGLFLLPAFLLYLLLTDCQRVSETDVGGSPLPDYNISFPGGAGGAGQAGSGSVPTASPAFLILLGALVLVVLVVFLRESGDDPVDGREEPATEAEESLAAVGAAAGRAADRIQDRSQVENQVYRAWAEMTDHLDLARPETLTPAEFAAEARAAGMDPAHVADLTDLFREVRYGGQAVTPDREARAVETLRKIEMAYAEEDGPVDEGGTRSVISTEAEPSDTEGDDAGT